MSRSPISLARRTAAILLVTAASFSSMRRARAEPPAAPSPASVAGGRPALDQLNRDTVNLHHQIAAGIVRIEVPVPGDVIALTDPLKKWDQLDPELRRRLEEQQRRSPGSTYIRFEVVPATQPATQPEEADGPQPQGPQPQSTDATTRPSSSAAPPSPHLMLVEQAEFAPVCIGIVIDDAGHVMVPVYIDRERLGDAPIRVMLGDGTPATAAVVAADPQTYVTVLQLRNATGKPLPLSAQPPVAGSLNLVVSLNAVNTRLCVWDAVPPDTASVIVDAGGAVAGFSRRGQFLSADLCRPMARQLIEHGRVARAFLGMRILPLRPDDPLRFHNPALAGTPALRVTEVVRDSVADRSGIRPGDLLLTLAGQSVGDVPTFAATLAGRAGPTEMTLLRGTDRQTVTIDLEPK